MSVAALPNRKPLVVSQAYSHSTAAEPSQPGLWPLSCLWPCRLSWADRGQGGACGALQQAAVALGVVAWLVLMYSPQFSASPLLLPRLAAHVGLAAAPGEGEPRDGAADSLWPRAALDPRSTCPGLPDPRDPGTVPKHYPAPIMYDREECRCTPVHNFVVLSMQRSGSGWFESLLNSHPNVTSFGEVFGHNRWREGGLPFILSTLDRVYNMDYNNTASKNACTAAVGFKWMLNQGVRVHNKTIRDYLVRHRVSVILLYRRNLLRRLVSLLANQKDKEMQLLDGKHQSHAYSQMEANILSAYKPQVNVKSMTKFFKEDERSIADAVRVFKSTRMMRVPYENILRGNAMLKKVQNFIGLPATSLHSIQFRIHTEELSESIRNFKDVAQTLRGTKYESFLHEKN